MKSLWNNEEAKKYKTDLDLRVYTSRLLGKDSSLVLHGGGNTSVKSTVINLFGETEDILYVKGSGWDLATIKAEGFAPVKMDMLLKMSKLKELNDTDMVKYQRLAMINPSAPNPSVEAILHAIIPFKFVDHTHTDAVVTITNTADGEKRIKELYGSKVLIIPYIMPGFVLAKLIYDMTRDVNWDELEGMVLLNHGLFTFNDDAKKSYEKTIELVDKAERYLRNKGAIIKSENHKETISTLQLAKIRKEISVIKGTATISIFNNSNEAISFSNKDIDRISQHGPLTPDHVIRTKRIPAILSDNFENELKQYVKQYKEYFQEHKTEQKLLNPAPNFAILPENGSLSFGKNTKEANIIKDINNHTFEAILKAEKLGGYKALCSKSIFDVEYWELEQAKLKKGGSSPEFSGKVAIVTSGASGTSLAIAKILNAKGCAVVVLDPDVSVEKLLGKDDIMGIQCDLTSNIEIKESLDKTVKSFGGIDIVVSMPTELSCHKKLIEHAAPFLKVGFNPTIVMIESKMSSELNEIASDKLGRYKIRVNTLHPNDILDTDILTNKVLENKAKENSMSEKEYKVDNLAQLVCTMAGETFTKTVGSKVCIDSYSDKII